MSLTFEMWMHTAGSDITAHLETGGKSSKCFPTLWPNAVRLLL